MSATSQAFRVQAMTPNLAIKLIRAQRSGEAASSSATTLLALPRPKFTIHRFRHIFGLRAPGSVYQYTDIGTRQRMAGIADW
jgi:hypothetical protein